VRLEVDATQRRVIQVPGNRHPGESSISERETRAVRPEKVAQRHVQDSTVRHNEHVRVSALHDAFQALPGATLETGTGFAARCNCCRATG
jgi:hypothetical protein